MLNQMADLELEGQPLNALRMFTWLMELEIEIFVKISDLHLFWPEKGFKGRQLCFI